MGETDANTNEQSLKEIIDDNEKRMNETAKELGSYAIPSVMMTLLPNNKFFITSAGTTELKIEALAYGIKFILEQSEGNADPIVIARYQEMISNVFTQYLRGQQAAKRIEPQTPNVYLRRLKQGKKS